MKSYFLLLFALFCILTSCDPDPEPIQIDCLPVSLQNDVLAFYPFNNGSLTDISGNGHDLTNSSDPALPTTDRNGNPDCAYMFSNSSGQSTQFLSRTDADFLNTLPAFSISLWYQPMDSARDGGIYETLIGRGENARCPDRSGEWSLGLSDCRRAVFGHDNSAWADPVNTPFTSCEDEVQAQTGSWIHAVAIKEGTDISLYINGTLQQTSTGDASCSNFLAAQDFGSLLIGNDFTGKIDDVLIVSYAFRQQDVMDVYDMKPCCQ